MIRSGEELHGPDGQGYRLKRDLVPGSLIEAGDFEPFGGAPEPVPGMRMPDWLDAMLRARADFHVSKADGSVRVKSLPR